MAKKKAKKHGRRLHCEELEPRVLFSADIAPGIDPASIETQVVTADENRETPSQIESEPETAAAAVAENRWELVLVNANVADADDLVSEIQAGDANRIIEVVTLDAEQDGIDQVSEILAERSDLSAVHVISHGSDGQINLGNTWLNETTLRANSDAVSNWGSALTDSGDILFYGCSIAAEDDGQALVGNLATLTGADVAASDDPTGHKDLGGDWELEHHAGSIEATVAPSAQIQASYRELLAVINGTTGDDVLLGTDGSDVISADAGADVLVGGGGDDQLLGEAGADVFRFTGAQDGDVYTVDGGTDTDTIDLTEFGAGTVTDDGATIVVDLGESRSFTINYTNIENVVTADTTGNHSPDADAGPDQTVAENTTVTLDAIASDDFDGDALTWSWTQTGGPAVSLNDPSVAQPTFTSPAVASETTLAFTLVVSDGTTSHVDTVNVTVLPTTTGSAASDFMTGTSSGDYLRGQGSDDNLDGGAGDDVLQGGLGDDTLTGGAGADIADYSDATAGVKIDLTVTTAQNTVGSGTDTLSGIEGVRGGSNGDLFYFTNPQDGAVYTVDGNGGAGDAINLGAYASSAVTFGDGRLVVDMGAGQSFAIEYADVDSIEFADTTATILTNDIVVGNWSGDAIVIDGGEAFRIQMSGGGTINWSYDRGSDTLSITSASGVGSASTLSIADLNGTDLRVDQITLDSDFGSLTTNTGVGTISLAGVSSDINGTFTIGGDLGSITMDQLNGTLDVQGDAGTITSTGSLLSGESLTVTGDVGTLSVGGELDASVNINGSVDTVDVAGKMGGGSSLSIGGDAGYVHVAQDIVATASVTITGNVTTFEADDRILGSVAIGGDAGTFALTGVWDGTSNLTAGASVTIGGNVTTLTVQGSINADTVPLLTVDGSVATMTVTGGVQSDLTIGGDLDSASLGSVDPAATITAGQVIGTLVFDVGGTDHGGTYAEAVYYVFDGSTQSASATVPDIASDLAVELLFSNTSGTTAVDTSGNNNDGTLVGGVTRADGAITVDYTDGEDYVEIANSPTTENLQEGDYSIAATFTPNSTPPGTGGDNDANYGIVVKAGMHTGLKYTNDNRFAFEHQLDGSSVSSTSASTFPPGQEYDIVVTIDRTAGLISLYVDGELQDTSSFTAGAAAREYGTEPWRVGIAYANAASWGWAADGEIDNVRMYSRALTGADAYTLANLSDNSTPKDISTTTTACGGLSLNQDGGDDVYLIADDGGAIFGGLTALTAEVRFSMDAFPNSTNFFSYATAGDDNVFKFNIRDDGNLSLSINSIKLNSAAMDYRTLADGTPHTLSVTWNSTGGAWEMFVDGVSVDSGSGLASGVTLAGGGTLVMGNDQDSVDGGYDPAAEVAATLYDARIFSDLRTAGEIAANFASTLPYDTSGMIANWTFNDLSTEGIITDTVSGNNLTVNHATDPGFTPSTATLTLSVDENAANGTVVGTVAGIDAEREARIDALLAADPDLIYSAETGFFYKGVQTALNWDLASTAALGTSLNGVNGQLATIRSATEQEIIAGIAAASGSDLWLGATDETTEGEWRWLEGGAEADQFWAGDQNGHNVNGAYANWLSGRPDNFDGIQHYLHIRSDGQWNDERIDDLSVTGYVVAWNADEVLDATDALTYSIQSQTVAGAFAIDANNGQITVADGALLDFETNPTHSVTVRVTDVGGLTYDEVLQIALEDANDAPVITSNGGGSSATINVAENQTAVTTVTATDADDDTPTFTLISGADQAKFDIDTNTGVLTFKTAPDFENPDDANLDGTYEVVVLVSDGVGGIDTQMINVTVTNVNEGPDQNVSINENTVLVANVWAGDSDAPPYGIVGGADASLFQVSHDPIGKRFYLMFNALPNFEAPTDSDGDNVYEVTVNFNDVYYNYFVTVQDANDAPTGLPTISGTPTEDQTLTVDPSGISDEDGLGSFSYQWLRDGSPISGATNNNHTLGDADVGAQISVQVSYTDGRGSTETVTSTQTAGITGINDAPVLDNSGFLTLTTITEDDTSNNGNLVSEIIASDGGDRITDADAGALEGIAIYNLSSGNGSWEYNIGSGWNPVGSVSVNSSLLLRATDRLRFVPDGQNADTAFVTFSAWDQTSGTAGTKVDTSSYGGTTAFSELVETAAISVSAVNDAPEGANNTVTTSEDTDYVFSAADFNFTDPIDSPGNNFSNVIITSTASNGTLYVDANGNGLVDGGETLNDLDTISVTGINAGLLKFKPVANANGTNYDSFTFQVQDDSGGSDTDQTPRTMTINVAAVNDAAPVANDDAYSVNEDATLTVDWWNTDWNYRQQLSFDNIAQAETLTDFPVLVSLNASNIDYTQTNDDGSDLRFFATDGTQLAHEIEQWNESGDSAVWVRVPQITGNTNSDSIWIYYGNASADSVQDAAGVWDSNFVGVWHLNQEQSGTGNAGVYKDSSGTGNNGIDHVAATGQDGQIPGGQEFGTSDWIEIPHDTSLDLKDSMTISFWIKPTSDSGTYNRVVEKGMWGYQDSYYFGGGDGTNDLTFYLNNQLVIETPDDTLTVGVWQHAALSFTSNGDGTGTARLYLNGSEIATGNYSGGAVPGNTGRLAFGHEDPLYDFDDSLDEVQISNTDRSADWIAAHYQATKNQAGSEFVQFGGVETAPADGGVLSNDSDVDNDHLIVSLVNGPDNAQSFQLNKDGTFSYTPTADFNGIDTFTYKVNDGSTDSATRTVTITVDPVNDAPTISVTNATPTFTENGGAVSLFSSTTIDPVESGDLIDTLQLTVDGLADGSDEILVVDGQDIALTHLNSETTATNGYDVNVSVSGTTATIVITKTGGVSVVAAEALVDGLAYDNASENPQGAARIITLTSIKDDGGTVNGGADT
ncbi:MAG: DUF2341 domain-containing protein, partial [Desulfosarcinaceae bacterium]|nr:DUF2341 domain-containing protein [Desulfosarcinaceae bacterium]